MADTFTITGISGFTYEHNADTNYGSYTFTVSVQWDNDTYIAPIGWMFYIKRRHSWNLAYPSGLDDSDLDPFIIGGALYPFYTEDGSFASKTLTIPASDILNDFPDSMTGEFEIYAKYYDWNGENDTYFWVTSPSVTISVAAPPSAAPILSDRFISLSPSNIYPIGAAFSEYYLQGVARVRAVRDTSRVAAQYSATLANWEMILEGKTYTHAADVNEAMSALLNSPGTIPIKFRQYDSRGLYSEVSFEIACVEYGKPTLSGIKVYRSDADCKSNGEGTYISVGATANIASVGGLNNYSMMVQYGVRGAAYDAGTPMRNDQMYLLGNNAISPNKSYAVLITASDAVGNTVTSTKILPTLVSVFDALNGGLGFAFGRMAEKENLLDNAWNFHSDGYIETDSDVIAKGDISAANGMFTEDVSAVNGTFTEGVSAANGTFTGDVSAVNMDASGALNVSGGAAFGGVSTSDVDNPKLESWFPAYLYGDLYLKDGSRYGWHTGDAFELSSDFSINGYVTSGTTSCRAILYLGQPIFADSITVSGRAVIRGIKGYLNSMDYNAGIAVGASGYSFNASIISRKAGIVRIMINKSSAYSNATNNTPVAITGAGNGPLKLTFV